MPCTRPRKVTWTKRRSVTGRGLGRFFAEEVAGPLGADFHIGTDPEHFPRITNVIAPPDLTLADGLAEANDVQRKMLASTPGLTAQVAHTDLTVDNTLTDDDGFITMDSSVCKDAGAGTVRRDCDDFDNRAHPDAGFRKDEPTADTKGDWNCDTFVNREIGSVKVDCSKHAAALGPEGGD